MLIKESPRRISKDENGWKVNNSGLDLIQKCPRKAFYVLTRPESETKSIALDYGSAIHSSLGLFYETIDRPDSLLVQMIDVFNAHASDLMKNVQDGEVHSLTHGASILKVFFDAYKGDPWKVYVDEKGPFVERQFEVQLGENLHFYGTIDLMLQHSETGELCVTDHKTTRSLGQQFAQKGDVNHQLTGYVFACQKMGINVNKAMFQGIKTGVKTLKSMEVMRTFVPRSEENFTEWKKWVYHVTTMWELMIKTNNFPMNGSSECNQYSGCQYLSVCAAPFQFREEILNGINKKTQEIEEV
jgi:hypothetical protein